MLMQQMDRWEGLGFLEQRTHFVVVAVAAEIVMAVESEVGREGLMS